MPVVKSCNCNSKHQSLNEKLRKDPTETKTIRQSYARDARKRFRKLKGWIRKVIEKEDALGIKGKPGMDFNKAENIVITINQPIAQPQMTERIESFIGVMEEKIDDDILEQVKRSVEGENWQNGYVEQSYRKGVKDSANRVSKLPSMEGVSAIAVEEAMKHPTHVDALGLLQERNFRELKGATEAMAQEVNRTLTEGVMQGQSKSKIASALNDRVDKIGITRANTIARTETVRAHSSATLNYYQQAGLDGVEAEVEHSVVDDGRLCETCAGLEGETYKIKEARGVIPVHPNCRCTWLPVTGDATNIDKGKYSGS